MKRWLLDHFNRHCIVRVSHWHVQSSVWLYLVRICLQPLELSPILPMGTIKNWVVQLIVRAKDKLQGFLSVVKVNFIQSKSAAKTTNNSSRSVMVNSVLGLG